MPTSPQREICSATSSGVPHSMLPPSMIASSKASSSPPDRSFSESGALGHVIASCDFGIESWYMLTIVTR